MYIFSIFIILEGFLVGFSLGIGLLEFLKRGHEFSLGHKSDTPIFRRFNVMHTSTKPDEHTNLTLVYNSHSKPIYSLHKLDHYVNHLKNEGSNLIRLTQKIITQEASAEIRNLIMLYPITKDYAVKMHDYYDAIKHMYKNTTFQQPGKKKTVVFPEGDLVILNLLEKSSELLYRQQWQLINTTPMNSSQKYVTKIHFISDLITKQLDNWKKTEMRHICTYYEICKPYPAFTDHLEHLVLELLKLPDEKLKTVMNSIKKLLMNNKDFLAVITGIKGKKMTFKDIEGICKDTSLRDSLTILRNVIHSKFKVSSGNSGLRLQALKVLFSIIDTAFQFNRDVNIDLEFEHLIAAIKRWNDNKRPFDAILVEQSINNILPKIFLIEHPAKSVLIETLIRGDSAQNVQTGKFIK